MRLPQEYWLKYLLAYVGATTEDINAYCSLYQYPQPPEQYLTRLRSELDNRSNVRETAWLQRKKIRGLATNEDSAVQARELLTNFKVRPILEQAIICGASNLTISLCAQKLANTSMSERTVAAYKHYFWNPELLSGTDWYNFLKEYHGPHGWKLLDYQRKGEQHALWKMGMRTDVETRKATNDILQESFHRFMELSHEPNGQDTAIAARMWSEQFHKSALSLKENGDQLQDTVARLAKHAIKLGKRDISSIGSLSTVTPKEITP